MVRRWCAAAVTVIATVLAMTVSGAAEAGPAQLRFDFDDDAGGRPDDAGWDSGCFGADAARGCVQATGQAVLRPVPREEGTALRFPRKGSAVIRVAHDDTFNPGLADFTVSALVRLGPAQIKSGANVIQKGMYDSSRGQWKLQVDAGVPSCRVSGAAKESRFATAEARANRRLDDGVWTSLHCVRHGEKLRLYVDGVAVDTSGNADVVVDNRDPVLIGGKHSGAGNDQFRGDLDDVGVTIE